MVEQSDSVHSNLQNYFGTGADEQISNISGSAIELHVRDKMHRAWMIQQEVDIKFTIIRTMMQQSEELVQEGVLEQGSNAECLAGTVKDYIGSFEPIMAQKD